MSKQSLVFSVELYRINIQVSMHTSFCTKLQQSRSTSTPLQSCKSVWFAAFSCVILQHLPIVIWFLKYLTCVIYSSRQTQTHTHTHTKCTSPSDFIHFSKVVEGRWLLHLGHFPLLTTLYPTTLMLSATGPSEPARAASSSSLSLIFIWSPALPAITITWP